MWALCFLCVQPLSLSTVYIIKPYIFRDLIHSSSITQPAQTNTHNFLSPQHHWNTIHCNKACLYIKNQTPKEHVSVEHFSWDRGLRADKSGPVPFSGVYEKATRHFDLMFVWTPPRLKVVTAEPSLPQQDHGVIKWWCQQEWGELSGEMALVVEEGSVYVSWEGEGCNVCQSHLVLLVFLICYEC